MRRVRAKRDITSHARLNLLRVRQLLPQLVQRVFVDRQHFGARAFGLDLRLQLLDLLLVLLEHARVGASRLVDLVFLAQRERRFRKAE